MSKLIPSFTYAPVLSFRRQPKTCSRLEVRAQSLRDEGRSSNLVDSNMKILTNRIEAMRTKERLETNSRQQGWNYDMNYIRKSKRQRPEYPQTIALICATMSFPVLTGTALVYIFSLIAHVNL